MNRLKYLPLILSFFIFMLPTNGNAGESLFNVCLDNDFNTTIKHAASPFGLNKLILNIEKKSCKINVLHQSFSFISRQWEVDVCRTPIHIKKGTSSIEVLRKENQFCEGKFSDSDFCQELSTIIRLIQDDGLIFAEGDKESIDSVHGKVFCAYKLLGHYLIHSKVFSRMNSKDSEDEIARSNRLFLESDNWPAMKKKASQYQVVPTTNFETPSEDLQ
jgi:hypothetical protein